MRRAIVPLVVAGLVAALTAAAATAKEPAILRGWPVAQPAGQVLPGPGHSAVVVSPVLTEPFELRAIATRSNGTRRWSVTRRASCGNCDEGPQPVRRQPDGTIGPLGPEGDDIWAITPAGALARGCSGAVLSDATCIEAGTNGETPYVRAVRGGVVRWRTEDPSIAWLDDFNVPPIVVVDGAGQAYAAFSRPRAAVGGAELPGKLLAVDIGTGALVWSRIGPSQVVTGLGGGVLAEEGAGLVALDKDGGTLWTKVLARLQDVSPSTAAFDPPTGRIHLDRRGALKDQRQVITLDGATGSVIGSFPWAHGTRILSLGRSGVLYFARDLRRRPDMLAVDRTGTRIWGLRTGRVIQGAAELNDGTVAISDGAQAGGAGRLFRVDPRRLR